MNQSQTTTIILTGDVAEWLVAESARVLRTPENHAEYLLRGLRGASERRKQASVERKAKRAALGFPVSGRGVAA